MRNTIIEADTITSMREAACIPPRISTIPTGLQHKRLRFPVKLSNAMTTNKSQG